MQFDRLKRRDVITLLGSAAVAWPLGARAQQPAVPVVGYLYDGVPETSAHLVAAFRKGLSETGFIEGQNVALEYRWGHHDDNRLRELAADLVSRRVAVIAAPASTRAIVAAKAATATIPIVFATGGDPVKLGLVASLNRPGGNITGVTGMAVDVTAKRLGLLHELVPGAARTAVLVNPTNPIAEIIVTDLQVSVSATGWQIEILRASTNRDIDSAFAILVQKRASALLVTPDSLFLTRRVQLTTLAVRHAVPAIYPFREDVEAGGLMSYGPNISDSARQVGIYVGRILKGEKPADLPVMRATRFEFVINLQTAKTLGLEIPTTLLARADEVIE
jgi:putative ABC transport system substrate-binding protein